MNLVSKVSSRDHWWLYQCRRISLSYYPVYCWWSTHAISPTLLPLRCYTRRNEFQFGYFAMTCGKCRTAFPQWVYLAPLLLCFRLVQGGLCFVANAFLFCTVFEIPSRILSYPPDLHLWYCIRCNRCFFDKKDLTRQLGHMSLRLLQCDVEGWLARQRTQCNCGIVH